MTRETVRDLRRRAFVRFFVRFLNVKTDVFVRFLNTKQGHFVRFYKKTPDRQA